MAEPHNLAEYHQLFMQRVEIAGSGAGVTTHVPCPFCCAPGFQSLPITDTEGAMRREATCAECGRSGLCLFDKSEPSVTKFEFVQTGGDDPPDWLLPKPRRVNRP